MYRTGGTTVMPKKWRGVYFIPDDIEQDLGASMCRMRHMLDLDH